MDRRSYLILILATLSTVATVVTIIIAYYSYIRFSYVYSGSNGGKIVGPINGPAVSVLRLPYAVAPLMFATAGWIATAYEVLDRRRRDISIKIRREVSGKRDGWVVYEMFKGRGAVKRLQILETLDIPQKRSDIARKTNTDWKEVDRNIKILESADLVRIQANHNPSPSYVLTEKGSSLLEKVKNVIEN